jgi:hypothetical protein
VEQSGKERIQGLVEVEANQRFPGAVQAVMVLEHGDERRVKPGKIVIRVLISPAGPDGQERTLRAFWQVHRPEMEQFRRDLSQRFPHARLIQFTMTNAKDRARDDPRVITMTIRHDPPEAGPAAGDPGSVAAGSRIRASQVRGRSHDGTFARRSHPAASAGHYQWAARASLNPCYAQAVENPGRTGPGDFGSSPARPRSNVRS